MMDPPPKTPGMPTHVLNLCQLIIMSVVCLCEVDTSGELILPLPHDCMHWYVNYEEDCIFSS